MKRYSGHIVLGLLALMIGLIISIQIKTTPRSYPGALIPLQKVQGLNYELQKVRKEKDAATQQIVQLEAKLKKIESSQTNEDDTYKNLVSDLDKYKMIAGVVDVKGPGIDIIIDDPPAEAGNQSDSSVIMYHYELLTELVNRLNDAGAEAISINGQRYISTTEIVLAGTNVLINSTPTAPPYTVKAIGNSTTLESTLNMRFGIIDQMKKGYGLQVKVEKRNEIVIPGYNDVIKFRYANAVK